MEQKNFREKSVKKFSSPESTDDYIKRAGAGRGIIIGMAILLAAAGIMWGIVRDMEGNFLQKDVMENEQVMATDR